MQDRYTADVGDFGKYGLLRAITGVHPAGLPRLSLGVVWYLTDEVMEQAGAFGDGKHVGYLHPRKAREFGPCDAELYGAMGAIIEAGDRRVAAIRERRLLGDATSFYEERLHTPIPSRNREDRLQAREAWLSGALDRVALADVVFVDPDKGVMPPSVQPQHKGAPQHATPEELARLAGNQRTLVAYHHIGRNGTATEQVLRTGARIREHLDASYALDAVTYHRGTARTFFIATPPRHAALVTARVDALLEGAWAQHFSRDAV